MKTVLVAVASVLFVGACGTGSSSSGVSNVPTTNRSPSASTTPQPPSDTNTLAQTYYRTYLREQSSESARNYEDATDWTCSQFLAKYDANPGFFSSAKSNMAAAYLDANPSALDNNSIFRSATVVKKFEYVSATLLIQCKAPARANDLVVSVPV